MGGGENVHPSLGTAGLLTCHYQLQLAVVVVSIMRKRSSLALGNIVGSTISNILGAFSLGLLFIRPQDHAGETLFDASSKIYTVLQLALTVITGALLAFARDHINWKFAGWSLILIFVLYILSIAWYIRKGVLEAPELSDSDSDSDSESGEDGPAADDTSDDERTPLNRAVRGFPSKKPFKKPRRLVYHIAMLILGLSAVVLSSFVLSYSASGIADALGLSDVLVGVVILSLATTLPEKFIAVMSGSRGHLGIMLANTAGSNIFLLALCLGITLVATDGQFNQDSVNPIEIGVMIASTLAMTITVWLNAMWARAMGALMLVAYVAFCVLEFLLVRK